MNSARLLFEGREGRGEGGRGETGVSPCFKSWNVSDARSLASIEITAKLGVEQSRINQPVNYSARRGNIGGESVAREVSIGRDTIQIDEVKIQTSPLGNFVRCV